VADLSSGLAALAEMAVEGYYGVTGEDPTQFPTLEIESAHTGESIKFKFGEGWLPALSTDTTDDIVIEVPKRLGIPLVVGYLLLNGAKSALDLHNSCLDGRLKQIELQLKENELHEKLSGVRGAPDALQSKSVTIVNNLLQNRDYTSFVVYDIDILNVRADPKDQYAGTEED
jgi:hypothetical protein